MAYCKIKSGGGFGLLGPSQRIFKFPIKKIEFRKTFSFTFL